MITDLSPETVPAALIVEPAALEQACANMRRRPWLALDTEFVREDTYYPQLCLFQVGDGQENVCIDPLALQGPPLQGLFAVIGETAITKVFHAASQDLEILFQHAGAIPQPLFDTQIAATMLGYGDQLGYAVLVHKLLGVTLDKSLTRTDWSRRPLRPEEIAYAAADVEYLARIYPLLERQLEARGRLDWLRQDCERLADPARYQSHPEQAWKRLKTLARLPPVARAAAAALAQWREQVAQQRNRPRRWILEDDALYRIAERRPQTQAQLEALGALPPKFLNKRGEAILELLAASAGQAPPQPAEEAVLDESQKTRLRQLKERVQAVADRLQVSPGLLASRNDLEAVTRYGADAQTPALSGWRREVIGEELLKP